MGYELVFILPLLLAALASFALGFVCILAKRYGASEKILEDCERGAFMIGGALGNGMLQLLLVLLVNLANKF